MSGKYYEKFPFVNQEGTDLKRFKYTKEDGTTGYVILESEPTLVTKSGTPISADTFNEIESKVKAGFDSVENDIDVVRVRMKYQGTIPSPYDLPLTSNSAGDFYVISKDNTAYVWTGLNWQRIGNPPSSGGGIKPDDAILKSEGVQLVFALPYPDSELLGQYFLLLSDTDPSHEYGHIYQLIDNAGTLEWQDYPLGSGGGGYGNDYCIAVTHTDSMPTTRPGGAPLKIGDTVYPVPSESFPFTISGYEFVDMSYEFTYAIKLDGTYTWVYKSGTKSTEDLLEQIKEQARIATSASTTAQTASTTSQTYAGQSIQARNDTLAYKDETKKLVQWGSLEDYNARLDAGQIEDYTAFFLIPPMEGS